MLGSIRGEIRFKERLAPHTALRCGGPADVYVLAQDVDDVRHALGFAHQEGLPLLVLGGGSGVLIRDRGYRGLVLRLGGRFTRLEFHGDEVTLGAGVELATLIREAASRGLGGLESLAGIPGTVGGAVATRAGTSAGSLHDRVSAIYFLGPDGVIGQATATSDCDAPQRVTLPPRAILLGVRLNLRPNRPTAIQTGVRTRLKHQRATHPLALAAAGYVWQDPAGAAATRLIEQSRLKGKRLGDAEISTKHANCLVNRGRATARALEDLMTLVVERVTRQTGHRLDLAMPILGE
jgi:UDP-N-acetylmuramate dehydrogenase